ncbi:MAG: c-type cytochrome [Candidatus Cyclobacteriaceae bacterium M3_2C_046]
MFKSLPQLIFKSFQSLLIILAVSALFISEIAAQDVNDTTAQQETAEPASEQAAAPDDGIPVTDQAISQGQTLFENNCTVCHQVHQQLVGPALADVTQRRPLPWLISFIKNSQKVIQSGDDYAVELYNQYNKVLMPSFDFSDEEVLNILAYIKQQSEAAPATAEAEPGQAADGTAGTATTTGLPTQYLNIILIGILIVLVLILVVLGLIISVLSKYLSQRDDLDEEAKDIVKPQTDYKKILASKPVIGLLAFVFVAIALKGGIDELFKVGVQQGYAPTQPVWFSHKIHAGQFQIDCNYCHSGAMESASATIPSVNICMNCHNPQRGGILQGTITGEAEIAKVVAAYQNEEPIEWVRVHNLPDLSYFNHAQHVNVGGIECQTCHGTVEEMDVLSQSSLLTMGWCIDCHRTTELNVEGNAYYDKLVQIHEEVSDSPLTVEDIGGTECSKCHY